MVYYRYVNTASQKAEGIPKYKGEVRAMEALKRRILEEGRAVNERILRVDSFLNHQVDPLLMEACGEEFARYYKERGITKVVTIESSGIAPALYTAQQLGVPLVIMKKQPSKVLYDNLYQTEVVSYTKGSSYELTIAKEYINENDNVLIVDDFLANGEAAAGALRLIRMAHATTEGMGVLIEKAFEQGREKLKEMGLEVYALVRIGKLSPGNIEILM